MLHARPSVGAHIQTYLETQSTNGDISFLFGQFGMPMKGTKRECLSPDLAYSSCGTSGRHDEGEHENIQ